jgi:hypothetical protein
MTTEALCEILAEAATEIGNLDSRNNPVAQRIGRAIQELRDPEYWDKRVALGIQAASGKYRQELSKQ